MKNKTIEDFTLSAREFERWVVQSERSGEVAARELLSLLCNLYVNAIRLPPEPLSGKVDRIDDAEWRRVYESCKKMPIDYYGEVFNPLLVPPEPAVVGSLSDDVADIYREVVSGLRAYDRGLYREAVNHWVFSLNSHWGEHVTGAIRALHCWLAKEYRLCSA